MYQIPSCIVEPEQRRQRITTRTQKRDLQLIKQRGWSNRYNWLHIYIFAWHFKLYNFFVLDSVRVVNGSENTGKN